MGVPTLAWGLLLWGMGALVGLVLLSYLVAVSAFFYIYHSAATRIPGRARLVRALFRRSAAEVDDYRATADPENLAQTDTLIVEHTKIYVKKALGCTVWILLLALTVFVVGRR